MRVFKALPLASAILFFPGCHKSAPPPPARAAGIPDPAIDGVAASEWVERARKAPFGSPERDRAVAALARGGPDVIPILLEKADYRANPTYITDVAVKIGPPAVPRLIENLGLWREGTRWWCAYSLRALGPAAAPAVPALIDRLDDTNSTIRGLAAEALGACGPAAAPAIPKLEARLKDPDHDVVASAAEALVKINPKRASAASREATLRALEKGPMTPECSAAVGAIVSAGDLFLPDLVKIAGNPGHPGRDGAFDALGRMGAPAVPALASLLESNILLVQQRAVVALRTALVGGVQGDMEPEVKALAKATASPDATVRQFALECLAQLGAAAGPAVDAITAGVKDPEGPVRMAALRALGAVGEAAASAVPALSEAAAKGTPETRAAAISAIGRIGPKAAGALPAIRDALEDPATRWAAAGAMARLGADAEALAVIDAGLADRNPAARAGAARALAETGRGWRDRRDAVLRMLRDEIVQVRRAATSMANAAEVPEADLLYTLTDPDLDVAAFGVFTIPSRGEGVRAKLQAIVAGDNPLAKAAAEAALQHLDQAKSGAPGEQSFSFPRLGRDEAGALARSFIFAGDRRERLALVRALTRCDADGAPALDRTLEALRLAADDDGASLDSRVWAALELSHKVDKHPEIAEGVGKTMVKGAKSPDPETRRNFVSCLVEAAQRQPSLVPAAVAVLRENVDDPDPKMKKFVADALARFEKGGAR